MCGVEPGELDPKLFEKRLGQKRADVFWPGIVLIEQKSAGEDLSKALEQASNYWRRLQMIEAKDQWPQALMVCDFKKLGIADIDSETGAVGELNIFPLEELREPGHLAEVEELFQKARAAKSYIQANQDATKLMAEIYYSLRGANLKNDEENINFFLVRLLFLLFADSTGLLGTSRYRLIAYLEPGREDGADLGSLLQNLFRALNTESRKDRARVHPTLADLPYINGGLFSGENPLFHFHGELRAQIMEALRFDWSQISPEIFGAMLQNIKDKNLRRELGEHYTSEANIMKVIRPLFLDRLEDKLHDALDDSKPEYALQQLREELGQLNFLDPACGCGNFLLVAYRELRALELKILRALKEENFGQGLSPTTVKPRLQLTQFHGIELEEWSARIAWVALYIAKQQADLKLQAEAGDRERRFPLEYSANIVQGNALHLAWERICPMRENQSFIFGNPPFRGGDRLSDAQKLDTTITWQNEGRWRKAIDSVDQLVSLEKPGIRPVGAAGISSGYRATRKFSENDLRGSLRKSDVEPAGQYPARDRRAAQRGENIASGSWKLPAGAGKVDFVANWFLISARHIARHGVAAAFVASSSITQGTQVAPLWERLFQKVEISFAYRSFLWGNEVRGAKHTAAVACVIIGLASRDSNAGLKEKPL